MVPDCHRGHGKVAPCLPEDKPVKKKEVGSSTRRCEAASLNLFADTCPLVRGHGSLNLPRLHHLSQLIARRESILRCFLQLDKQADWTLLFASSNVFQQELDLLEGLELLLCSAI